MDNHQTPPDLQAHFSQFPEILETSFELLTPSELELPEIEISDHVLDQAMTSQDSDMPFHELPEQPDITSPTIDYPAPMVDHQRTAPTNQRAIREPEVGSLDPVRQYLNEIGRYPLLTKDDEFRLAYTIRGGVEAAERLAGTDHQSPAEKRRDLQHVRAGEQAKQQFIQSNLRLVVYMARRLTHKAGDNFSLMDLIQEGNLGLEHSVDKFDPDRGFRFSTYSTWWIRNAIYRGIAKGADTVRLPGSKFRDDVLKFLNADEEDEAIIEEMFHWDPKYIEKIKRASRVFRVANSDSPFTGTTLTLTEVLSDPADEAEIEDSVDNIVINELLDTLGSILDEHEMKCLILRAGLTANREVVRFSEISEQMGMTTNVVRRIYSDAIKKLSEPDNQEIINHYRALL